jgi:hypothetical protein
MSVCYQTALRSFLYPHYFHLWVGCLEKMWEPRRLTTLCVFTACWRDSFTFFYLLVGWCSVNFLNLYRGHTQFKSRPRNTKLQPTFLGFPQCLQAKIVRENWDSAWLTPSRPITSYYSHLLWHCMNCEAATASLNYEVISTLLRSLQAAMAHTESKFSHKTDLFPL